MALRPLSVSKAITKFLKCSASIFLRRRVPRETPTPITGIENRASRNASVVNLPAIAKITKVRKFKNVKTLFSTALKSWGVKCRA